MSIKSLQGRRPPSADIVRAMRTHLAVKTRFCCISARDAISTNRDRTL